MRLSLTIIALLCAILTCGAQPHIVPTPRSYVAAEGYFTITPRTVVEVDCDELLPAANYLAECLSVDVVSASQQGSVSHSKLFSSLHLSLNSALTAEAYRLEVSNGGVAIEGGDYGGLFCGVQTLLQLLPAEVYGEDFVLPCNVDCCVVEDAPLFGYRGFMLDVCRTWLDKEAVMAYIDLLAYHKINVLRLHLTDDEAWRIEIKSHPELAEVGGFRGGDSPVWPRYGKWNEKWGGYYTQEDMRAIIAYAAVRNIEVIPEIDLPGHSLCMATMHPEVLCRYTPDTAASLGYDDRNVFCASREENYTLLEDILAEVCELFPSEYIHIGGDEVDMSQWKRCPDCQTLMRRKAMSEPAELQAHMMRRISDILAKYGKRPAVWNEAVEGGKLPADSRVYGWEGLNECRAAAAEGYPTVVVPGQYLYFDMKQSAGEPGHDWAAIFDMRKVYGLTLDSAEFTDSERQNVVGFEATFFSEIYASSHPERADYLHYMTFPRMLSFAAVAWGSNTLLSWDEFYRSVVAHYDRLDAMGVAYRLMPPQLSTDKDICCLTSDDGSVIYCRSEVDGSERPYANDMRSTEAAGYSFVSRRGKACSPEVATKAHTRTIQPAFCLTSSMGDSDRFSFAKAEGYGRLARTTRAARVGDWIMYTFDKPVACRRMKVATGNFQLPRYLFENGYVEVSYDGESFVRVGELECGIYTIVAPPRPIKAVRIVSTSEGNGARWVSIQPPTIWPVL